MNEGETLQQAERLKSSRNARDGAWLDCADMNKHAERVSPLAGRNAVVRYAITRRFARGATEGERSPEAAGFTTYILRSGSQGAAAGCRRCGRGCGFTGSFNLL